MPLPTSNNISISDKDVVSFVFDDPTYDIDKPVLIDAQDPSLYFSHRSAKQLVTQIVAGLHATGLEPGDSVCIHSFNSIWYPLLVLGIIGAGGLTVGTNPSYTKHELNHAIKVAKIKFVFAEPELMRNMCVALEDNHINPKQRLFILDARPGQSVPMGFRSWKTLTDHGQRNWIRFDDQTRSTNTVAQLYFTSGTTGLPKCACTTHKNLVAQHEIYFGANPRSYPYRIVLTLPVFHIGAQPQTAVSSLRQGWDAYVMPRFDLHPFLQYHAKYNITEMFIVPPMVKAIVMSGLADSTSKTYNPSCSLKSVRNGTSGAAPCSGDLQKRFSRLLAKGATFTQVWGMTETTCVATMVPWHAAQQRSTGVKLSEIWGSIGKPLPCIEIKLVDEQGTDVTSTLGQGEICVKGPTVMKGYLDNVQATTDSRDDQGYFKTGDIARVDEYGLLHVVERVKELIKVRGFQCAPAELEGALTEHEDIIDAAVIGVKVINNNNDSQDQDHDQDADECPKAFIVKRPGSNLTHPEIHKYMKTRVSRFKQLTGGIEFIDDIPKSPSGKMLKRLLRERETQGKPKIQSHRSKL